MGLFSKNELIIMVSILGVMLLIIVILTVLDLIDERKNQRLFSLV